MSKDVNRGGREREIFPEIRPSSILSTEERRKKRSYEGIHRKKGRMGRERGSVLCGEGVW